MKEVELKKLLKLSNQVEELGSLLRRYFEDQKAKSEEELMKKFTHVEKMAYLKGKSTRIDSHFDY